MSRTLENRSFSIYEELKGKIVISFITLKTSTLATIAVIVAVIGFFFLFQQQQPEGPPPANNGTGFTSAVEIGRGTFLGSLPGPSEDGSVWFKIYLEAGSSINISLTGDEGTDFDLDFYDENMTLLASAWEETYPDDLSCTITSGGWYRINIIPFDGEGAYALSVNSS